MHPALEKYTPDTKDIWGNEQQRYMNVMAFWVRHVMNAVGLKEVKFNPMDAVYDPNKDNGTGHIIREVSLQLEEQVPKECRHLVHYGCTSEDVMDFAEAVALYQTVKNFKLRLQVIDKAFPYFTGNFMGMTHGLPATPVVWDDAMRHYSFQIFYLLQKAPESFAVKWGGACGRKTAMKAGMPNINWESEVKNFVLSHLHFHEDDWSSKQISTGVEVVDCLHWFTSICYVIEQMSVDFWLYNSRGIIKYGSKDDGSSAMPHKDNPSAFERAEGMARHAGRILPGIARDRIVTRMQRDLSGMFVARELPGCLGYVEASLRSLSTALLRSELDRDTANKELEENPQSTSEIEKAELAASGNIKAYQVLKGKYRNES